MYLELILWRDGKWSRYVPTELFWSVFRKLRASSSAGSVLSNIDRDLGSRMSQWVFTHPCYSSTKQFYTRLHWCRKKSGLFFTAKNLFKNKISHQLNWIESNSHILIMFFKMFILFIKFKTSCTLPSLQSLS